MALIQRPLKHLGTRSYVTEVAIDPNDPILDNEVDDDFAVVYGAVNGNLDTTNLSPTANIVGSQLSPTANILGSQLSPTAGIVGTQLANGTITTTQIADGTILNADLAPGAGVHTSTFVVPAGGNVTAGDPETDLAVLPSITTRGGIVMLMGTVSMFWLGTGSASVITKVYRDGVVLQTVETDIANANAGTITVSIPTPQCVDGAAAPGAHVYKFTLTVATAGLVTTVTGGSWFAVEIA